MYSFSIDTKTNFVTAQMEGELRPEDFQALLTEVINSPDYRKDPNILIDQRKGRLVATGDDVRLQINFVKTLQEKLGVPKVAIVVSTSLDMGLNRMFEIQSEGNLSQIGKIFRNPAEAKAWLLDEKS